MPVSVFKSSFAVASSLTAGLSLASAFAANLPSLHFNSNSAAALTAKAETPADDMQAGTPRVTIAIAVSALDLKKLNLSDFGDADAQR